MAVLKSGMREWGMSPQSKAQATLAILTELQKMQLFSMPALLATKEALSADISNSQEDGEEKEAFYEAIRNIFDEKEHEGVDLPLVGPKGAANAIVSLLDDLKNNADTGERTVNIMSLVLATTGICSLAKILFTPLHAKISAASAVGDLPVGVLCWRPGHWECVNNIASDGIRLVSTEALGLHKIIERFWSLRSPNTSPSSAKEATKKGKPGKASTSKNFIDLSAEPNTNSALAQIKEAAEAASKSASKARSAADKASHRADLLSTENKKDRVTKAAAKAKKDASEAADHAEADKVKARDILAAREKSSNKPGAVQDAEAAAECARSAAKSEEAATAAYKSLDEAWKNRDTIPDLPTNASVTKSAEERFASLSADRRATKLRVVKRALRAGVPPSEVLVGVMSAGTCMFGSRCSHRDTCTFKHPPAKKAGAGTAQGGGTSGSNGGPNNRTNGGARGGANNQQGAGEQHAVGTANGNPWATGGLNRLNPQQPYVTQNNNTTPLQIPASIVFNTHQSPPAPTPSPPPRPSVAEMQVVWTTLGAWLQHQTPAGITV
jgi:hypothetical protein